MEFNKSTTMDNNKTTHDKIVNEQEIANFQPESMEYINIHYPSEYFLHNKPFNRHKTIVYIDGIACAGKTTLLREFQKKNIAGVIYNDYNEMIKRVPDFKNKHSNINLDLVYTLLGIATVNNSGSFHTVVDRTPLSSIWYNIIFKLMEKLKYIPVCGFEYGIMRDELYKELELLFTPKTNVENPTNLQEYMKLICSQYSSTIMLTTKNPSSVAKALLKRDSSTDKMLLGSLDIPFNFEGAYYYVVIQNTLFQLLRDCFVTNFIFYEIEEPGNLTDFQKYHKMAATAYHKQLDVLLKYGKNIKKRNTK